MYTVNDWEGELPFGKIFREAFIRRVLVVVVKNIQKSRYHRVTYLGTLQIHQIITNLKKHADQIYKWNVVPVVMSDKKQRFF